jgi:hypothetical protein
MDGVRSLIVALVLTGTAVAQSTWSRPRYQPGGNAAVLRYLVYGRFKEPLEVSSPKYRTNGLPKGVEVRRLKRPRDAEFLDTFLAGPFQLTQDLPKLARAVRAAPEGVLVQGEIADPKALDYLRDTVGVITALFDSGGVAVYDMHARRWHSAATWRQEIFDPNGPVPRQHVSIIISDEKEPGKEWIHTQGLRKFGRPDVSVRNVPAQYHDAIIDLCNRFIEMLAFGAMVPDGQPIKLRSLPPGMTCHHRGSVDDPDFLNSRVEIDWP